MNDLDALSAKVREAQRLDAGIQQRDMELGSLQKQIDAQSGVEDVLQQSTADLRATPGGARKNGPPDAFGRSDRTGSGCSRKVGTAATTIS